jgi:hypothetical protein
VLPGADDLEDRIEQANARARQAEASTQQAEARARQAEASAQQADASAQQARAETLREALLTVLAARGIPCPAEPRARIEACGELSTLRRWLARANTVGNIDEVLGEAPTEGTASASAEVAAAPQRHAAARSAGS